jgi:hypothetical protein
MQSVIQAITIAVSALVLSAAMAGSVFGANIYVEGSLPSQMFEVVKPVVGDKVTPIFILGDDSASLMSSVDQAQALSAGVAQETLAYYLANLKPDAYSHGILGYALGGYGAPGNEDSNRTCAVVIGSREQMKTTSTFFHEAVHCKNFYELRADPDAWRIAVSMNSPSLGLTDNQFMSLFHEVLAAYVQVAYAVNQDVIDGLGMVIRAAEPDKNTATSIGYRTARSALAMCAKQGACSTNSADIVRMLAADDMAREAVMADIKELFDAASATGYIVENR